MGYSRRPVKARGLSSLLSSVTVALRIREFCLSADPWASRRKGRGGAVVLIKWAGDGVEAFANQLLNRLAPEALFSISTTLDRPLELTIVGGLLFSKLLTLETTPIIYLYLERLRLWMCRPWRIRQRQPAGEGLRFRLC
jgi:hypothetical protein